MFHDPDSHEFLAIVASIETFHNGTLGEVSGKEEGREKWRGRA